MTNPTYANFDLLIDRGPTGYRARVIGSLAGEGNTDFTLPFTEEELADFLWRTASGTRHLGVAPDEAGSALDPRAFGARLYAAAFAGPVGLCLRRSLDEAERRGVGLRLRLRLDAAVLDLAELPWEFLFAPDLDRFLALSDLTPIVRYVELDRPVQPLRARLPLTVLAIVSNPSGVQPLAVEREWHNLQGALSPLVERGVVALERLEAATLPALQARLRRGPVDLLHFVGHGFFDPKSNTGGLVFENEQGQSEIVTAETLGMLLHDHEALRLIFLNACEGAQGGRSDPFAGIAQRLAQQGAPAVLAMQFPVTDAAAIALSQAFYQSLADGLPADAALSEARKAIAAQGNPLEWATPVLFSRSEDNRLFDLRDVLPPPACPYPGMVPFRAEDARFFYGREDEIEQMLRHLRHQRLLFIIGPSGSGKSSLVAAGLLPKLASSSYFPPGYWLVRTLRPGSRPLEAVSVAIQGDVSQPAEAVAQLLAANAPAQRVLLVIDQFEETFSLAGSDERQRFISAMQTLRKTEQCVLLIALRADFYPDLMNSDLWPVDASQRLDITALRGDALRRAIRQPASEVKVEVEDALVERLMADAAGEPGVLPMLQETLVLLWGDMSRWRISLENYEQLGDGQRSGLAVAIATKADATLVDLTPDEQGIARRIFLRLIQFGQGRADTRRQLSEAELRSASDHSAMFERVLKHLADNRLLTLSGGESGAARLVDISHERLITEWPKLNEWVKHHKEAEQMRRRLEVKAQERVRLGRGEGGLLDKAELAEANVWLTSPASADLGVSNELMELMEASRRAINPGWNRWGTLLLALTTMAVVSLLALAVIKTEEIHSEILRITIWVALGALFIFLLILSGVVHRRYAFQGQHLSQFIAQKRWSQVTAVLVSLGAILIWSLVGQKSVATARYCGDLGYSRGGGNVFRIALLKTEEIDPFYLGIMKNVLATKQGVKPWLVDPKDGERCVGYFDGIIRIHRDTLATEVAYTATILGKEDEPAVSEVRSKEDCSMAAFFAHKVASGLNLDPNTIIIEGDERTLELCRPFQLNSEGWNAFSKGDFAEAQRKLQEAISLAPDYAGAHHNLAQVHMYKKQFLDAVAEAQTEVKLQPNSTIALNNLGVACFLNANYECASESIRSAIRAKEQFESAPLNERIMAYSNLATVLRELGKYGEAEQALDRAKELIDPIPVDQQRTAYLGLWYKNQGVLNFAQQQWSHAITDLEKAKSLARVSSEEITYYLAKTNQAQGNLSQACRFWRDYQKLQPDPNPRNRSLTEDVRRNDAAVQQRILDCKQ